jgi:hypothetical protein
VAAAFDLVGRLRAWTYRRQRLGRAGTEPLAALRDVVGVYSNHPTAPLALLARSRAFAPPDLPELEQRREAIRLAAMRGSVFLLPAETVGRIFAATRQPLAGVARRLRDLDFSPDDFARLKDRVSATLREPLLPRELPGVLGGEGEADEARIVTGVRIMTYEGLVLRVGSNLRSNILRYVATEAWLGHPLEEPDPAEALAWLAREYLRGYGPARIADFAWWAGTTLGRARAALAGDDIIDLGQNLLLPADQQEAFARAEPLDPDAIDLLPKWDSYTMGFAPDGRQRLLNDEHLKRAYSQGGGGTLPGDGFPLVLRGGRAVATWGHRFTGNRLHITVTPFEPNTLPLAAVEQAAGAVGQLLSASTVEVVSDSSS